MGKLPRAAGGKNDSSPIRAAAAKKLAHDPEPDAGEALAKAAADKDWKVRAAALDAIALREDASLVARIASAMDDKTTFYGHGGSVYSALGRYPQEAGARWRNKAVARPPVGAR